jgi:hypothetical protein
MSEEKEFSTDIDWAEQIRLHQEWVAQGKSEYLGWVSI